MKPKIKKYGSFLSLSIACILFVLFAMVLPELLLSSSGRLFAICWALLAISVVMAHSHNLLHKERRTLNFSARRTRGSAPAKMYRSMN